MWTFGAEIPDGYVIVILGAVLPALLLVVGWAYNRLGTHDKDLAVLKEQVANLREDVSDLRHPDQPNRSQRRDR